MTVTPYEPHGISSNRQIHCLYAGWFQVGHYWSIVKGVHGRPLNSPHKRRVTRTASIQWCHRISHNVSSQTVTKFPSNLRWPVVHNVIISYSISSIQYIHVCAFSQYYNHQKDRHGNDVDDDCLHHCHHYIINIIMNIVVVVVVTIINIIIKSISRRNAIKGIHHHHHHRPHKSWMGWYSNYWFYFVELINWSLCV